MPQQIFNKSYNRGFSLVELSVVLVILALIAAGGISVGMGQLENARVTQTEQKLSLIEDALMTFRKRNGRLPCPADGSLADNNANLGTEAGIAGACAGANFSTASVSGGVVPTKALNLPESMMLDGWGNRIHYAVNTIITSTDAFSSVPANDSCGGIGVNDASGSARTSGAVYSLVSSGKNGHGAYMKSGIRKSASSTNADELENCDCTNAGVSGTYDATYVQRAAMSSPTTAAENFDDIMRYKLRWQMQAMNDTMENPPTSGAELALAGDFDGFFRLYERGGCSYSALADPADLPADTASAVAFSADNIYVAIAGEDPRLSIYKRGENAAFKTYTRLTVAEQPSGDAYAVSFAPNGLYLATGHAVSPYLTVHQRSGDSFSTIAGTPVPASAVRSVAFSSDSKYLAIGGDSGTFDILKRSGSSFSSVAPTVYDLGDVRGVAFSADTIYLAIVATDGESDGNSIIYKRSGDVFTAIATPFDSAPTGDLESAAFAPNGKYLAIASQSTPFVFLYKRDGDSFTKLANPTTLPAGEAYSVSFSKDSGRLAVGHATTPFVTIYNRAEDSFIAAPSPTPALDAIVTGTDFSN